MRPGPCEIFDEVAAVDDDASLELASLRAEALFFGGRAREARECVRRIVPLLERGTNPRLLRRSINLLGAACFELGELEDAANAFQRAHDLAQRDGDFELVAKTTNNLGAIANVRGDHEGALMMYSRAVAAHQCAGQPHGLAHAYHNMAITFRQMALLQRADEHERRAIEYGMDVANQQLVALARIGRAEIKLLQGDARVAEIAARRVVDDCDRRADPIRRAEALRVVGSARAALGDAHGARSALDDALGLARRHQVALVEAEVLRARAELAAAGGDIDGATDDATRALSIFERLGASIDCRRLSAWIDAVGESRRYDMPRNEAGEIVTSIT